MLTRLGKLANHAADVAEGALVLDDIRKGDLAEAAGRSVGPIMGGSTAVLSLLKKESGGRATIRLLEDVKPRTYTYGPQNSPSSRLPSRGIGLPGRAYWIETHSLLALHSIPHKFIVDAANDQYKNLKILIVGTVGYAAEDAQANILRSMRGLSEQFKVDFNDVRNHLDLRKIDFDPDGALPGATDEALENFVEQFGQEARDADIIFYYGHSDNNSTTLWRNSESDNSINTIMTAEHWEQLGLRDKYVHFSSCNAHAIPEPDDAHKLSDDLLSVVLTKQGNITGGFSGVIATDPQFHLFNDLILTGRSADELNELYIPRFSQSTRPHFSLYGNPP